MLSRSRAPRIAVIDDDPVFLELMTDLLAEGEGYDILTCGDWSDSYTFVLTTQPDLVILDLMMGREQNGWFILDQLKANPLTRKIPVLVCSAAVPALDKNAQRLQNHSVSALTKPFDLDHLLELVAGLVAPNRERTLQAS